MTCTQLSPEKRAMHEDIATAQKETIKEISDAIQLIRTAIDLIPIDKQLNSIFGSDILSLLEIASSRMTVGLDLLEETAPADAILLADEVLRNVANKSKIRSLRCHTEG